MCADIGSQGATCDNFLSSNPVDIRKDKWDDLRFGELCISPDAWGDFKTEIEQLCSASGHCDYDTKTKINAAVARINRLENKR